MPTRILIVRLSALGDIVHAVPVLSAIGRHDPAAEIDWLVEAAYAPVLSLVHGLRQRVIVRARAVPPAAGAAPPGGSASPGSDPPAPRAVVVGGGLG